MFFRPDIRFRPKVKNIPSVIHWSTILHHFTHNEIQFPTAACQWPFALRDVFRRQSCHLSTPSHPRLPSVWPYCRQAQCGRWHLLKWSIADLLTSQSSSNVSLPFACITGHATNPSLMIGLIAWPHIRIFKITFYDWKNVLPEKKGLSAIVLYTKMSA